VTTETKEEKFDKSIEKYAKQGTKSEKEK